MIKRLLLLIFLLILIFLYLIFSSQRGTLQNTIKKIEKINITDEKVAENEEGNWDILEDNKDVWDAYREYSGDIEEKIVIGEEAEIVEIELGDGTETAKVGDTVEFHWKRLLKDAKVIDSSYERGELFRIKLSSGNVKDGWYEGVVGMKVGGKRRITIPGSMVYVEKNSSRPPDNYLIFEVELVEILK